MQRTWRRQRFFALPCVIFFRFLHAGLAGAGENEFPVLAVPAGGAAVYQVAFSPDGRLLAAANGDGTIKLLRSDDGSEFLALEGHKGKVLSIAFHPAGRRLLSGGEDKTVKVWNLPPAAPSRIAAHEGAVRALLVTPDGRRIISGADDRTVRVWSRDSGKEELKIADLPAPPISLAASQGGAYLAAGLEDRSLRVWVLSAAPAPLPEAVAAADLVRQGEAWRMKKGTEAPPAAWKDPGFDDSGWAEGESGFGYSQDPKELSFVKTRLDDMQNRYLAIFIRKRFRVDDPGAVEKLTLKVHTDDGFAAWLNGQEVGRFNLDGSPPGHDKQAKSSIEIQEIALDLTPQVAKLAAGENVLAVQGHNSSRMSSDFILLPVLKAVLKAPPAPKPAGAQEPQGPGTEVRRFEGLSGAVLALALSHDGKDVVSAGESGAIQVHSIQDGSERMRLEGHGGAIRGLGFLPDGRIASGSDDGKVRIWSLEEKKAIRTLPGHSGPVRGLSVRPDRKTFASCGEDGTVRLWDSASGREIRSFLAQTGPLRSVALGLDGKLVAAGSASGEYRVFQAESVKLVERYPSGGKAEAIAAGPEGRLYFAGSGGEILEWRLETAAAAGTFSGHTDIVHSVAFSPDGKVAASASADSTVRLWRVDEGREIRTLWAHPTAAYCVAFSPDGKTFASAGFDLKVKTWGLDGQPLKTFDGHDEGIFCLAYTPDGRSLLSGSSDRSIRRWDALEGKPAGALQGHPEWVSDLKMVPGKPAVLSVDYGGNLFLWDLGTGKPLARRKVPAIVHGLAVSPDGKRAAAACQDGNVLTFKILE